MLGEGSSGQAKTEIGFRGGQRAIDHDEPGPGPGGQDEVRRKIKQNEPFTRPGVPCTRLVYMHVILRYNTHTPQIKPIQPAGATCRIPAPTQRPADLSPAARLRATAATADVPSACFPPPGRRCTKIAAAPRRISFRARGARRVGVACRNRAGMEILFRADACLLSLTCSSGPLPILSRNPVGMTLTLELLSLLPDAPGERTVTLFGGTMSES